VKAAGTTKGRWAARYFHKKVPDPLPYATLPLFPEERNRVQLARAMDEVNLKFGPHTVYFAGMFGAQFTAPMRISFTSIPDAEFQA